MNKLGALTIFILFIAFAYALTFEDKTQSDFDNGTYVNTTYNGNGVILSGNNLTGTFTSRVFDATSVARWENMTKSQNTSSFNYLFCVDNGGDIYKSIDLGANWVMVQENYGRTTATTDMFSDNNYLYITTGTPKELWRSKNGLGDNFSVINNSFPYSLLIGDSDNQGNLYVALNPGLVYKSIDFGQTWIYLNDINPTTADPKGIAISSLDDVFIVDGNGDVWKSNNSGQNWTLVNNGYGGGSATDDMEIDSNNSLYILLDKKIYKSNDSGITWLLINDSFTPYSNNGVKMLIDSNDNCFIVDTLGRVFKSINKCITWLEVGDCNNEATSNPGGFANLFRYTNLTFQIRNCSFPDCSDGAWQNVNLSNINLTGRYFQYKAYFSSQEAGLTPKLYNASIDYTILDNVAPQFSNFAEDPANNSAYVFGQNYGFNVTITESNPGSVWIEWQGVNYTNGITNVSSVYTFSRNNLGVGTYSYRWWANDSLGNLNFSDIKTYVVGKGNPSLNMNIIGTTPITYGNISDFNGVETNGGDGGCVYSMNRTNQVYGVGTYVFNYSTTGCSNYTLGSVTKQLTVNKATPVMLISGNSLIVYGTPADIIATENNNGDGDLIYFLYRNGLSLGSNSDASILAAGDYNYLYITTGGQNYTSIGVTFDLSVAKKISITSLIFDKVSPQPYGITINVSCSSDNPEGTLILYRNDIDVTSENNQDIVLPMGTYNYTCNVLESQNYSSATYSETFNIEKALGNVKLYLNGLEDNITIFSIQQLNITATTLYGNVTIYLNGTDITSENGINTTKSAGYYNVTAFSSGDENHSSAEITRWLNITEDLISPSISIISPSDGITYGYNENISLDFTVSDENLDSCWHNINSGSNVTISNCQNTNFSVAGSGNYTLYFYANDSYGNENSLEIIFSVQLDAPTILISFPSTVYLNYTNITFRYTPSDIDLETCELWGDFDGEFKLNQIDNNPSNYIENTFNLTLSDGVYRWNVRCSDSNGHSAFDGNKVFYVDTISPGISISQPQGKRTSRIGIPLQFSISDSSPTNCWYNVEWAIGGIVKANSSIANCFSTSFDLAADGNYILNFYVNDSASNFNFTNSSFTVDTSTPPSSSSSSSGGGGGGSGGVSIPKLQSSLSSEKIQDILVNKGGVKKILRWKVKNNGTTFLNECKFKSKGQYSSWIAYTETKGLAVGEEYTFVFDVNIPEAIEPGNYNLEVDLECKEVSTLTNFILQVVERKLDFVLVDFSRESDDSLKVKYSIEELSGEDQNVELQFLLFDSDGRQVTEVNETKYVPAKTKQEFETLINIDKDLSGKLNLLVNLNSETFSTFVQESLVLGSPISGFSISNIIGGGDNIISVILVILFLVFAFFIVKRIRHHKKTHRERVREMIRKNHHWK